MGVTFGGGYESAASKKVGPVGIISMQGKRDGGGGWAGGGGGRGGVGQFGQAGEGGWGSGVFVVTHF